MSKKATRKVKIKLTPPPTSQVSFQTFMQITKIRGRTERLPLINFKGKLNLIFFIAVCWWDFWCDTDVNDSARQTARNLFPVTLSILLSSIVDTCGLSNQCLLLKRKSMNFVLHMLTVFYWVFICNCGIPVKIVQLNRCEIRSPPSAAELHETRKCQGEVDPRPFR